MFCSNLSLSLSLYRVKASAEQKTNRAWRLAFLFGDAVVFLLRFRDVENVLIAWCQGPCLASRRAFHGQH